MRRASGMTQEETAEALDISINTYRSWEQNKATPHVQTIMRIASLFDCKMEDLVDSVPQIDIDPNESDLESLLPTDEIVLLHKYRAMNPKGRNRFQEIAALLSRDSEYSLR
jgi:transcriptional regulator with XRE-family HTH domain